MKRNKSVNETAVSKVLWFTLLCFCLLLGCMQGHRANAATEISRIDLVQPMPSIGQKVSDVLVTTSTTGVEVTVKWYPLVAYSSALSASQTFEAGSYSCEITIETKSNYTFSTSARAYINGEEAGYFSRKSSTRIVLSTGGTFTIAPNIVISNIDLIIPELLDGLTIDNAQARTSTDGVVITETKWYMEDKVTGSSIAMQNMQSFIGGQTYYCVVLTKPALGYEYTPMPHAYFGTEEAAYFGLRDSTWLTATSARFIAADDEPDLGTMISRIDFQLVEPFVGQKASEVQATTKTPGVLITDTEWYHVVAGEYLPIEPSVAFEAGGTYWPLVHTIPATGYSFDDNLSPYFGASEGGRNYFSSKNLGATPGVFTPVSGKRVDLVEITLTTPEVGMYAMDAKAVASTEGVAITSVVWYSLFDGLDIEVMPADTFRAGSEYLCRISIELSEGYQLATTTKAVVNKAKPIDFALSEPDNGLIVVRGFNPISKEIISEIEIQLTPPLAGQIPRDIIPTTSTKGIVSEVGYAWHHKVNDKGEPMLPTDEFAKNETYYCYIALSIEDGYTFDSVVRVLLNGKELTFSAPSHGMFIQGDSYDFSLAPADDPTTTIQRTLQSITNPANITKVPHGAAKTVAGLGLPATVLMVTDDGNVPAEVTWSVGSSFYDPKVPTSQTFIVQGIVSLPKGVLNPKDIPLSTSVNVTVLSDDPAEVPTESVAVVFTIDSKIVTKNGITLPEIDVPAMIIAGRTMIPFRYFIETALGGTAHFDAETYTITATVNGHTIVMVIDDVTIYVDGIAEELTQAPTIVNSRTLVPLRMVDSIAQSVGWDPTTREATIIM